MSHCQFPWRTVFSRQEAARGFLRDGQFLLVPIQAQAAAQRHVAQQARGSRAEALLDVTGRPLPGAYAFEEVGPVVRVAARRGLHLRLPAAFALRYQAVALAVHVEGRLAATEENAAALVEHRLAIGVAILVNGHEARIFIGDLQRIGRLPVIGEPKLAAYARDG